MEGRNQLSSCSTMLCPDVSIWLNVILPLKRLLSFDQITGLQIQITDVDRLVGLRNNCQGDDRGVDGIDSQDEQNRYQAAFRHVLQYRGATLADTYEARTVIEPYCAGLLASRRTKADLDQLWQSVEEAEEALKEDPNRFIRKQPDAGDLG